MIRFTLCVGWLILLMGCQHEVDKDVEYDVEKIETVKNVFATSLWNNRQFEVAPNLFHDDFVTLPMAGGAGNWVDMHGKGPESMVHHIKWWLEILPDAELHIQDIAVNADTVIENWVLKGTMKGALLGVQPTNQLIKIHGCTVSIFEGKKIKLHKTLLDKFDLMQQIGAL